MYTPKDKILERYADVLVNFAINCGEGLDSEEVVYFNFDAFAKPLAEKVYQKILEAGSYPIYRMADEDFGKIKFDQASKDQLKFFPKKYYKSLVDTIDHRIVVFGKRDPLLLQDVKPSKITTVNKAHKPLRKWFDAKEDKGEYTWTIGMYGTAGMAKEANLSIEEYWEQIINACFLKRENPIKKWKSVFTQIEEIRNKLNNMPIDKIHLVAHGTDIWITLGEKREWKGGSGHNIPSFEIFTSPDWRETEGHISFDLPLYRYGNIIKDIYLEFEEGKVVKAKAAKNQDLLEEIVKQENANKIGEFSLTDHRFSNITEFMANTLYDENHGGKFGNTHIALGNSYHDTFDGDPQDVTDEKWKELGFNESIDHVDIIATTKREVTVILDNGKEKKIYQDGEFLV